MNYDGEYSDRIVFYDKHKPPLSLFYPNVSYRKYKRCLLDELTEKKLS